MVKKQKNSGQEYYSIRKKWFEKEYWPIDHKDIFKPNGINNYQELSNNFSIVLNFIDYDGKIIDLGCGNGLLLQWLRDNSKYRLEIFGVDFIEKSIRQAKRMIPDSRNNFFCKNIIDFDFDMGPFDFILFDPLNVNDNDFNWFLNKLYNHLNEDGKIIMYIQVDEILAFKKSKKINYIKKIKADWFYNGRLFGVIKKANKMKRKIKLV